MASIHEIAELAWLVVGSLAVAAVIVAMVLFRREIGESIQRMSNFRIKRKGTEIGAELGQPTDEVKNKEQQVESIDRGEVAGDPESRGNEDDEVDTKDDPVLLREEMFESYIKGEEQGGNRRFERLRSLESDPIERKRDEIRKHGGRYMGGIDPASLEILKAFTEDGEVSSTAHSMIGRSLHHVGKSLEAADEFKCAFENANTASDRAHAMVERAICLADAGQQELAIEELGNQLSKDSDSGLRAQIWTGLARVYSKSNLKKSAAVALHQAAVQAGNEADKWFDAGYAYTTLGSPDVYLLAMHCFRISLKLDSSLKHANNNLGVVLAGMDLPIEAIDHYRRSADKGATLSMANIADCYLQAGFASEADDLLKSARADPEPHKRVANVTADLEAKKADEAEKLSRMEGAGARAAEFMADYAVASWKPAVDSAGEWKTGEFEASASIADGNIEITWKVKPPLPYRRFIGSLEGAAMSGSFEIEAEALGKASTV
jgi:tetratricopeptide (TPR) repeat protein